MPVSHPAPVNWNSTPIALRNTVPLNAWVPRATVAQLDAIIAARPDTKGGTIARLIAEECERRGVAVPATSPSVVVDGNGFPVTAPPEGTLAVLFEELESARDALLSAKVVAEVDPGVIEAARVRHSAALRAYDAATRGE